MRLRVRVGRGLTVPLLTPAMISGWPVLQLASVLPGVMLRTPNPAAAPRAADLPS